MIFISDIVITSRSVKKYTVSKISIICLWILFSSLKKVNAALKKWPITILFVFEGGRLWKIRLQLHLRTKRCLRWRCIWDSSCLILIFGQHFLSIIWPKISINYFLGVIENHIADPIKFCEKSERNETNRERGGKRRLQPHNKLMHSYLQGILHFIKYFLLLGKEKGEDITAAFLI